jgi:UDP-3-O-[3-hydroxymyristoyl] N-acetylglucosamine deacetylase
LSASHSRAARCWYARKFLHPLIGVQKFSLHLDNGAFSREIAAARTFGFTDEIEALRRANLIRGGSLENAIVLTADGMLNKTGLRFRDEFVRHKILDIIGDLALLGMPILGKVVAERSGHIMHAGLMSKLLRVRSAWDIVDVPDTFVPADSQKVRSLKSEVPRLLSTT